MIYMLEEVTVKPGRLREYLAAYQREYVPGARARGLELVGTWVTPPLELDGESNTVVVLWSMADVDAFWTARKGAAQDANVHAWWQKAAAYQVSRSRRFLQPAPVPAK